MGEYTQRDKLAMAVAWLTADDNSKMNQADIQHSLGISSPAEVSRLLSYARSRKWIKQLFFLPYGVNEEEIVKAAFPRLDELRNRLSHLARENGGVAPTDVHVLYSGPQNTDDEEQRLTFGRLAAERIETLLHKAKICAVAWGRTIDAAISGFESHSVKAKPQLTFLPVSGEPMNHIDSGVSPSVAAKRLAKTYGSENVLSLLSVAARIPKRCDRDGKTIRRFMACCRAYESVFGNDAPLIEQVDTIISGIGDAESSEKDPWFCETQEAEEMKTSDLSRMAIGNIGGVWLPQNPKNNSHVSTVDAINSRWLGIQKHHFEICSQRAAADDSGGPGVLLLAVGQQKANIVRRSAGLVNHFLIDHRLADKILDQ